MPTSPSHSSITLPLLHHWLQTRPDITSNTSNISSAYSGLAHSNSSMRRLGFRQSIVYFPFKQVKYFASICYFNLLWIPVSSFPPTHCYDLVVAIPYLICSMRATMPAAIGAAAEVPEKDLVQPPWMLASVVTMVLSPVMWPLL